MAKRHSRGKPDKTREKKVKGAKEGKSESEETSLPQKHDSHRKWGQIFPSQTTLRKFGYSLSSRVSLWKRNREREGVKQNNIHPDVTGNDSHNNTSGREVKLRQKGKKGKKEKENRFWQKHRNTRHNQEKMTTHRITRFLSRAQQKFFKTTDTACLSPGNREQEPKQCNNTDTNIM